MQQRSIGLSIQKIEATLAQVEQQLAKAPALPWLPQHHLAAINLIQYLKLRQKNRVALQNQLHEAGLSSLASAESHIHRQVQEVMLRLGFTIPEEKLNILTAQKATRQLQQHAQRLFGPPGAAMGCPVMVTIDSNTHLKKGTLANLMRKGMSIARINCAHDTTETWAHIIDCIKAAEKESGCKCKIYMDLAGPKFRLQLLEGGKPAKKVPIAPGDKWLLTEAPDEGIFYHDRCIYCQIPGITHLLQKGCVVMMDDGMVEAMVTAKDLAGADLTITRVSGKPFLKSGKGINFPGTLIPVASLTADDIAALEFVKQHADMVGYSFVRTVQDLAQLHAHLYADATQKTPGLIIKIETPESVNNLPDLLLYAMRYPSFGVMIARGDLAVEIGFERMSEIQEEILWICEAAHTPVIWATQVLEQLNKTGIASRSEITDAYKAGQAECIMVNKGPYTHLVLDTLKDVVERSKRHHLKKRYELQALGIARRFSLTPTLRVTGKNKVPASEK